MIKKKFFLNNSYFKNFNIYTFILKYIIFYMYIILYILYILIYAAIIILLNFKISYKNSNFQNVHIEI